MDEMRETVVPARQVKIQNAIPDALAEQEMVTDAGRRDRVSGSQAGSGKTKRRRSTALKAEQRGPGPRRSLRVRRPESR